VAFTAFSPTTALVTLTVAHGGVPGAHFTQPGAAS